MKTNKKVIVGAIVAACYLSLFAEKGAATNNVDDILREIQSAPSGGLIFKPYSGKLIHVVNLQKKLKSAKLCDVVERIRIETVLPVYAVTNCAAKSAQAAIAGEMARTNVAFVLVVTNEKDKPTILCAPEERWCVLNLGNLAADFPSDKRFEQRATKELWRAFMYTMGVGHSMYLPCLMKSVYGVNDLDRNPMTQPGPEPFNKAQDAAAGMGVGKLTIATYRTACEKGWAPPPDTAERKAIWDEYHATPTSPIIIKPETKKQ